MARRVSIAANILFIYVAWFLTKLEQVPFLTVSTEVDPLEHPESVLNFTERSIRHGYQADEHTVLTDDGYKLTLFHLMPGEGCVKRQRPPLLLMHGVLMSSDTWLDAGPGASLAYLLSDACFDVWAGNIRGNNYGRNHMKLDPDTDREFWDFSTDEMGAHDVPATVDYVIGHTGSDSLDYIGFSQGAGVLLIMCSERPVYCGKLRTVIMLAPATRLVHSKSALLKVFSSQMAFLYNSIGWFRSNELLPKGGVGQALLSYLCKYDMFLNIVCSNGLTVLDNYHEESIKPETLKLVYANFPTGTSVRTFARYGQAFWSDGYSKFDYGEARNLEVYGVPSPPYHNISAVTPPVVIMYGRNDYLVDSEDIKWLSKSLPNVRDCVAVADPLWNHLDFMYSQHIKTMVFPTVLEHLLRDGGV